MIREAGAKSASGTVAVWPIVAIGSTAAAVAVAVEKLTTDNEIPIATAQRRGLFEGFLAFVPDSFFIIARAAGSSVSGLWILPSMETLPV